MYAYCSGLPEDGSSKMKHVAGILEIKRCTVLWSEPVSIYF
jgi:hypothetical protein